MHGWYAMSPGLVWQLQGSIEKLLYSASASAMSIVTEKKHSDTGSLIRLGQGLNACHKVYACIIAIRVVSNR